MDQNPPAALDGSIDEPLRPINDQSHTCKGKPRHRMSLRWKVPNEILFLRVSEINDHVFEVVREPRFDRERLFRVSNAHPVGRGERARERVPLN